MKSSGTILADSRRSVTFVPFFSSLLHDTPCFLVSASARYLTVRHQGLL